MTQPAISVRNLSKCYKLGTIGRHTLVDEVQYLWHKIRGRDPRQHFSKIGHSATEARKVEAEREGNQEFWALKDVSFDVQPGEVVGVIGGNGAGKSTLLKILTQITEPTHGDAFINGRVASLLEVGTGFHPELTGRENVYMNGSILGMKKREITDKFDEIVAFSELEKFIDTPVKRYSSGMYVRLAFAVAAHLDPEIMLVDEVLAVGDMAFQRKCLGRMKDVASHGRTIIFVSHNMNAIRNLCRRVLLLEKGKVILDTTAEHGIARYLDQNLVEGGVATEAQIERKSEGKIDKSNRYVRLLKVELLDEAGQTATVFESDKPIGVLMEFECLQSVRDLRVLVNIVDENNVPIIGSENMDHVPVSSQFMQVDQGFYRVSCVIPPNLLGGKTFSLSVHMINPKTEHIVVNKILEFEVRYRGYNQEIQYSASGSAFVWPQLQWDFGRIENSLTTKGTAK